MLNTLIKGWAYQKMATTEPDVVIGEASDPYLLRWWVIPRNPFFNLYLHHVLRSDDDRALHDHPWVNMSYIVDGAYTEITPGNVRTIRPEGTFKARWAKAQHRLELHASHGEVFPCVTLFATGPRLRRWGFQCPKGWVYWRDFTKKTPEGTYVASGCGEIPDELLHKEPAKSGFWPLPTDQA